MSELIKNKTFTLRAVYLRESKVLMKENFNPLHDFKNMAGTFRISNQQITHGLETTTDGNKHNFFLITTCFEFGYLKEQDAKNQDLNKDTDFIISISARISVDYSIKDGDEVTQEDVNLWASRNTLIHAWPYWREYCQSTQTRMNLPVMMIPLYNLNGTPTDMPK